MSSAVSGGSASAALAIAGERLTGSSVREYNSKAAQALANLLKSSLGPLGLDKMLVSKNKEAALGDDVNITNDGATILSLLDIGHPAARILAELARQQDTDVGDGTTSVVLIASELIRRGVELIRRHKLHPTTVIAGYRLACREAVRYVEDQLAYRSESLGRDVLVSCARTSLSSKVLSGDHFARLAVDAMTAVKTTASSSTSGPSHSYPVKAVQILKARGASQLESELLVGSFALNCTVACEGMPKTIKDARIACLDLNLQRTRMHQGVTILIDDPLRLEAVRKREIELTTQRISSILKSGANVVLTAKGIDDLALKMFVEQGAMAVRRVALEDLRRIAAASGATVVSALATLEGEEAFDPTCLGHADSVTQERYGDDECLIIRGLKNIHRPCVSVILRGGSDQLLDEMERALHDALCVLKRVLETQRVVAGGGCVETALSVFLENLATTIASKEQLAVAEFGESLLVIPKILVLNAGLDGPDLVAKLRSRHYAAQSALSSDDPRQKTLRNSGLNLLTSGRDYIQDCVQGGVLEPAMVRVRALQSATEAAAAILRIDDFVKVMDIPQNPNHH